jgi:hypothetical protein
VRLALAALSILAFSTPYAWKENSSLVDKLIFDDLKGKELIE